MTVPAMGDPSAYNLDWWEGVLSALTGATGISGLKDLTQDAVAGAKALEIQGNAILVALLTAVFDGLRNGIPLALSIIEAIVVKMFGLIPGFDNVTDAIAAIEEVPAVAAIVAAITGVAGDLSDLATYIAGKWDSLATVVANIASLIASVGGAVIDDVGDAIIDAASVADDAIAAITALITAVGGTVIGDVSSAITTAASNASSALSQLNDLIAGVSGVNIADVVSAITGAVTDAGDALGDIVALLAGMGAADIHALVTGLIATDTAAGAAAAQLASLISGVSGAAISDVVTAINNGVTALSRVGTLIAGVTGATTISDVVTAINGATSKLSSLISGVSGSTISDVVTAINSGVTALSRIASLISGVGGATITDVVTAITNATANIQTLLNNLYDAFNGTTGSTGKSLANVFSISQSFYTTVSNVVANLQTLLNNLFDAFNGTTGSTGKTLANVLSIGQTFYTTVSTVVSNLQSLLNNLYDIFNNTTGSTGKTLANVLSIGQTFYTTVSTVVANLQSLLNNLFDAFSGTVGSTGKTLANVLSSGQSFFSGAAGAASQIATILSGLGLADATALMNWLKGIVDRIVNALTGGIATGNPLTALTSSIQNAFQGLLPAAIDNLDGTYTALTGLVDNLDGTFAYTPGVNPIQTLIDQGDGTWATVAEAFNQAVTAATAVAGNTLTAAANSGQQAWNMLVSTFGGFSPQAATPAQANTAVAGAASTLSSNSGSIASINATLAALSSGGGTNVGVNFSTVADGSLPATLTVVSGSGISVSSGAAVAPINTNEVVRYNAAQTQTDYQIVSAVFTAFSGNQFLLGRMNSAGDSWVMAFYASGLPGWLLVCCSTGSVTDWGVSFSDSLTTGAVYSLVCGVSDGTNRQFKMLKNGSPLTKSGGGTVFTDSGNASQLGASYRYAGFGVGAGALTPGSQGGVMQMSLWNLVEGQNLSPTGYVATSENTGSTSYTDLTTTTDQVTVTIGPSGMCEIYIYGFLQNNSTGQNTYITFTASGANTIAASDAYAISMSPWTGTASDRRGAPHLLTGLAQGSTTFKLKYRVAGGTGTFADRRIAAKVL